MNIIIPITFTIITIIIWYTKGRDTKIPVNKTNSTHLNAIDTSLLYNEHLKNSDFIALIIQLANNGYIKIEEISKKKKTILKLTRLKEYTGYNKTEKTLLNNINKSNKRIKSTVSKLKKQTKNQLINKNQIYGLIINIFIYLTFIITFIPLMNNDIFDIIYIIVTFIIIKIIIQSLTKKYYTLKSKTLILLTPILVLIAFTSTSMLDSYKTNHNMIIISTFCLILMIIIKDHIPQKTKEGIKEYSNILGFINYIENLDEHTLRQLTNQNPNFYYEMLPYTLIFNNTTSWIDKFQNIELQQPSWYSSYNSFEYEEFTLLLRKKLSNITNIK